MAFLMTPPTRATLPVAEMSSVRTHTKGMLLRHRRRDDAARSLRVC